MALGDSIKGVRVLHEEIQSVVTGKNPAKAHGRLP